MKNAFTLVELIFSIVIIAVVFTVVPKLMFVTTKTMEITIKEDGLFSGIALMGNIIRLPWDENTVLSEGKILHTDIVAPEKVCAQVVTDPLKDRLGYRRGGFVGSRNCLNSSAIATPKVSFGSAGSFYSDIDDYDGYSTSTTGGRVSYNLDVDVNYADINLNTVTGSDELKEVNVSVSATGKTNLCASFFYYSANLGHIQINKRAW
ncbi:type II secretion system protein [Campylobacterota bacterium]